MKCLQENSGCQGTVEDRHLEFLNLGSRCDKHFSEYVDAYRTTRELLRRAGR